MAVTDYEAVPSVRPDAATPQSGTVVMKFGGTSVADPDKIKNVARRLVAARDAGSPRAGAPPPTARTPGPRGARTAQFPATPDPRATDMPLPAGERATWPPAAPARKPLGPEAISLTGKQAGSVRPRPHEGE